MNSLFEDLKQGLEEAIEQEKNNFDFKSRTFIILPIKEFSSKEIREIRMNSGMTQRVFAAYMGVSQKTVEAWECGRTHPTGPAYRLMDLLVTNKIGDMEFIIEQQ